MNSICNMRNLVCDAVFGVESDNIIIVPHNELNAFQANINAMKMSQFLYTAMRQDEEGTHIHIVAKIDHDIIELEHQWSQPPYDKD